mmetsp:Transcript_162513/g.516269  ORF Transcript_162513/g.516269 Transcript_162513/m.516269 type:complete len:220 (+) Transcript_162513:445-1104(+)
MGSGFESSNVQRCGYVLSGDRLFIKVPITTMMTAPRKAGAKMNFAPMVCNAGVIVYKRAVAPPGGCTEFARSCTAMVRATLRAAEVQIMPCSPTNDMIETTKTPTAPPMELPMTAFEGCARGALQVEKMSTDMAPKAATSTFRSNQGARTYVSNKPSTHMPAKEPKKLKSVSTSFGFGAGSPPAPANFERYTLSKEGSSSAPLSSFVSSTFNIGSRSCS